MSRKGLAVLRIEKPGCGDSEGGPARNVDFDSIVDGYVEAVRQLKQNSRINNQSIWLFGVSMGGFQAPLVAARENVQGVAVFGTMLPNWREFMVDSVRRQLLKTPASAVDIESDVAAHATGWHYVINEMMMPDDLAVKHQDLMDWVDSNFAEGLYFSGIHVKFFQQAGKADIAGCLEKLACPVLAIWGDEDIVTSNAGHQWLVDIVNRKHPGKASLVTLPRVDHNLQLHTASPESAAPIVVDKLHAWIKWAM